MFPRARWIACAPIGSIHHGVRGDDTQVGLRFTCDGTRTVGLFWRDALTWPLVWDHHQQTAIQSPIGGTKISWDSWGRTGAGHNTARSRRRFKLVSADPASAADRLVSLGATHLASLSDRQIRLADPDGNEFRPSAE